jgi:hypothetical protein
MSRSERVRPIVITGHHVVSSAQFAVSVYEKKAAWESVGQK